MSTLTNDVPGGTADHQPQDAEQPASATPPDQAGEAPALSRPTVPVSLLTAHPGNVRRDLDLSEEFVASIRANGVLVPLRITPEQDGAFRVIDGHRRLAAAVKVGLAEVPADLADDRATDDAGQFLDMWTAHRHRNPLSMLEEADALFAARQAGATKARIRKSTGLKPPEITAALAAARLSDDTRDAVQALPQELTLEDLSTLAEFEGDDEATEQLLNAARWHGTLHHQAERLRQERADKAEHDRLHRELGNAGYSVTAALPPGAQPLTALAHDGEDLTRESHAGCPGRGVFFRTYDLTTPVHYCTDPATHGHIPRHQAEPSTGPAGAAGAVGTAGPPDHGPADADRRQVVQGNRAWKAAAQVRKRWLAANLFPRRTAQREVAQFVARQLLTMPDPLRQGLASAHIRTLFGELTGQTAEACRDACDTTAAGRLPLLMLAPIVVAYEQAMTEGEGRNTWRPGRYSPCPRREAGHYLVFLASLGYQLSSIEQAVADGSAYTGDTPPGDPLPGPADEAQGSAGGTGRISDPDPGDADATPAQPSPSEVSPGVSADAGQAAA